MIHRAKQGWHVVGGSRCYFRSRWEHRYALHLDRLMAAGLIKSWAHEPTTFWFDNIKRGVRSYKPDFRVDNLDGTHHWIEVKGYMDPKSLTKIKRFRKYYPEEELVIVAKEWFEKNKDWV